MRTFHTAAAVLAMVSTALADEPPIRCIEPSTKTGTSRAVVVGNVPLVFTSQVLPLDVEQRIDGKGDAKHQAAAALARLDRSLRESESSLAQVVKLNVYAANDKAADAALRALSQQFTGPRKPAVSVVVTRLSHEDALVAMDAVAVADVKERDGVTHYVGEELLKGHAFGGVTRCVLPPGRKIYVAGQAEKTDDLKTATQKTMESLVKTLEFLGRSQADIVQLKTFAKPVTAESAQEIAAGMKAVLGDGPLPPVVLVEWESSLPIEIELVAFGGPIEAEMPAVEYLTPPGMTTPTIYSRVARTASRETIFVSGLFGKSGQTAKEETEELFSQLGVILKAAGSDFRHLAKATYYVATEDASSQLNVLRPNYYDPKRPPAASKAMVRSVGLPGRTTTMDMIAVPAK